MATLPGIRALAAMRAVGIIDQDELEEILNNTLGKRGHSKETQELLDKIRDFREEDATFSFAPSDALDSITLEPIGEYYFRCNGPLPHFFIMTTIQEYIERQCCRALTCSVDRTYQIEARLYRDPKTLISAIDDLVEKEEYEGAANHCYDIASSIEDTDDPNKTYLLRGTFYNKAARLYELSGDLVRAALMAYEASNPLQSGKAYHSSELATEYAHSLRLRH